LETNHSEQVLNYVLKVGTYGPNASSCADVSLLDRFVSNSVLNMTVIILPTEHVERQAVTANNSTLVQCPTLG